MQQPAHIAIVGCGFSGTSTLAQLVERFPVDRVSVFESSGVFGPGYPYQTHECEDYLLNNTADSMGVFPGRPTQFLEWLAEKGGPEANDPKAYLPRSLFGRFLRDVFESTCRRAESAGIRIDLYPYEVSGVVETTVGIELQVCDRTVTADAAILTTGRCAARELYPDAKRSDAYLVGHIDRPALDELPMDARIHVLGASLSAFDVVNRLFSERSGCYFERDRQGVLRFSAGTNRRSIVLCSRSGALKAVQSVSAKPLQRPHFNSRTLRSASRNRGVSLREIWRLIRNDAAVNGVRLSLPRLLAPYRGCGSMEAVNERARTLLECALCEARDGVNFLVRLFEEARFEIWDLFAERMLAPEEEARFRLAYETVAMTYAAPCPAITAERLLALFAAGRLEVRRDVRRIGSSASGELEIVHGLGTELASTVINATGATNRNVRAEGQSSLIQSMSAQQLLAPHERGGHSLPGARIDMTTFRAAGSQRLYMPNMFLWGPGFHTSSALTMSIVIDRMLSALFPLANR